MRRSTLPIQLVGAVPLRDCSGRLRSRAAVSSPDPRPRAPDSEAPGERYVPRTTRRMRSNERISSITEVRRDRYHRAFRRSVSERRVVGVCKRVGQHRITRPHVTRLHVTGDSSHLHFHTRSELTPLPCSPRDRVRFLGVTGSLQRESLDAGGVGVVRRNERNDAGARSHVARHHERGWWQRDPDARRDRPLPSFDACTRSSPVVSAAI